MSISVTFEGLPAEKVVRLKKSLYDAVGKSSPDEVTELDVEQWLKLQLRKRIKDYERRNVASQAQSDYNATFVDPF